MCSFILHFASHSLPRVIDTLDEAAIPEVHRHGNGVESITMHRLKHLSSETLVLGILVFPVAVALATLVGLASWMIGGQEIGLQVSWITWCATMVVAPISLRLSCGPDTRAICDRCIAASRHRKPALKEQRRHARYRVELPATFSNDRTCGFVMIGNISAGGCRVESKVPVTTGDVGQLLIDLPGCNAPLKVPQALVRWVTGNACGMEFLRIDQDAQRWLNGMTGQLGVGSTEHLSLTHSRFL